MASGQESQAWVQIGASQSTVSMGHSHGVAGAAKTPRARAEVAGAPAFVRESTVAVCCFLLLCGPDSTL